MSSLFNLKIPAPEKIIYHHPWERVINDEFASKIKYAHNSVKNPKYPKEKIKPKALVVPKESRVRFTIVGNRVTKEFIYCVNIVKGLHKYRSKNFDPPIIRAVTSVEWPYVWNELKIRYGELAYCLDSQVAVLMNDTFLGGENELKEVIEANYIYHLRLDYYKEGVNNFATYVRSSGRPCAYFHFTINDKEAGSMVFMLYSDIVPYTCENFLRLCKQTRGGYGGTPVHRIVKDGWIQCGGFGLKNNNDLGCENFIVPHDQRGVLCMANDGRNVDCSTQFFILLQPAPWMEHKYVAFGQLIDGEGTLQRIEQVPTFYESPTQNVTIFQSGIFNMDCHDITINKKAKEYIFGHIDDLYALGELFYEALLENVWAEIERREQLALTRAEMGGEMEGEGDLLKDSKRFISNKEEIEKQLKSKGATPEVLEEGEPEEFHYDYEYEGSQYHPASVGPTASLIVKPEKPFYLPLTDVPYPDEVDSTYDLKKFLKGDYCHETDIDLKLEPRKVFVSEMLYFSDSGEESKVSSVDLDSDEEREIKKYLSQNVDRVSFAGGTVKKISRAYSRVNIFEGDMTDVINDELLRKLRTTAPDMQAKRGKKVSVSISASEEDKVHHQIKRRQTGFVRPNDMERIRMLARLKELQGEQSEEDEDKYEKKSTVTIGGAEDEKKRRQTGFVRAPVPDSDEEDDEDEEEKTEKKPTVKIGGPDDDDEDMQYKKKRRQTGFVRAPVPDSDEDDDEDDEERKESVISQKEDEAKQNKSKRKSEFVRKEDLEKIHIIEKDVWDEDDDERRVRMSPKTPQQAAQDKQKQLLARRPTGFVRPSALPVDTDDTDEVDIHRPSVLQRLYDDVAVDDDDEEGPTLKDYKPKTEHVPKKLNLLTTEKVRLTDESQEKYIRPSLYNKEPSNESHVLNLQHSKKLVRKISSDYVKTIDQIEKRQHTSIRSIEFAKARPALSVTDYQSKNSKYQEELRSASKHQVKHAKSEDDNATLGLRLPGDTPLYSISSTACIKEAEAIASRVNMVRSKLSRIFQSNHNR